MQVDIRTLPARRLGAIEHRGPYAEIGTAFRQLGAIVHPDAGLLGSDVAMIALYHDNPRLVPANELRSDAAIGVAEDASLPAPLVERRLAGGRHAVALHKGPYEGLPATWAYLFESWLPASGLSVADGPPFERYLNDPSTTPKEELLTEVCVRVQGVGEAP